MDIILISLRIQDKGRRCKVCGHEWLIREREPERCPNLRCRSKRWKTGEDGRKKAGGKLADWSD
jgi:hypothetical protein